MAYPSDLVRTKNWGNEILTDTDLEGQLDLIIDWVMAGFDETSGHSHDATANEGPQIILDGVGVGVTGTLGADNGGTGAATLTDGAILLGSGTSALTALPLTTDGAIVIGDGTTDPTTLSAFTSATGALKHEQGGIEADISAIAKGGIVSGTGTGTMGIKAVGTDGQALLADSTDGSGVAWGAAGGLQFVGLTSVDSATDSGEIVIEPDNQYEATIWIQNKTGTNSSVSLRFNSSATSNTYEFATLIADDRETPWVSYSSGAASISLTGQSMLATGGYLKGKLYIDTYKTDLNHSAHVTFHGLCWDSDASTTQRHAYISKSGFWLTNATIEDFEILPSAASNIRIRLFKYLQS